MGFDKSKRPAPPCPKCKGNQQRTYGGMPVCSKCQPQLHKALVRA